MAGAIRASRRGLVVLLALIVSVAFLGVARLHAAAPSLGGGPADGLRRAEAGAPVADFPPL